MKVRMANVHMVILKRIRQIVEQGNRLPEGRVATG